MATNAHPGSDYYVSVTGTIQAQANPVAAEALKVAGWSGPYTYAKAKSVADNVTQRIAGGYVASETGGIAGTAGATAQQDVTKAAKDATSWETSLGSFFWYLSQKKTWVQVVKIVIGGGLLIVGASKLTGIDQKVAGLGKVVAKAPLL
jgi:hypothetical protein